MTADLLVQHRWTEQQGRIGTFARRAEDAEQLASTGREELRARREIVLAGLADLGLPVPVVPDGAFYVYLDVTSTGMTSWQFCEQALHEAHVALTPGNDFGLATADTHVRLSYAATRDDLREGLARLAAHLHMTCVEE